MIPRLLVSHWGLLASSVVGYIYIIGKYLKKLRQRKFNAMAALMSITAVLFPFFLAQSEADLANQQPAGNQAPAEKKGEKAAGTNDIGEFIGESSCMEPDIGRTIAYGNALKAAEKSACGEEDHNVRLDAPPPGGIEITSYNCPKEAGKFRMHAKLAVNRAICSDGRLMFFDSATFQWKDLGVIPELAPPPPPEDPVAIGEEVTKEIQKICREDKSVEQCVTDVTKNMVRAVGTFAETSATGVGMKKEELREKMLSKIWRGAYYLTLGVDARLAPIAGQIAQRTLPSLPATAKPLRKVLTS